MALKVANNAKTKISAPPSGTTGLSFSVVDGTKFPVLGAGDWTFVTRDNGAGQIEVVKISARSGNSFTIEAGGRAADGTTAYTWSAGDLIELRPCRAMFQALIESVALTALGVQVPAADRLPYFTGAETAALATLTAFARTLLAGADQAAWKSALGVVDPPAILPVASGGTGASSLAAARLAQLDVAQTFTATQVADNSTAAVSTTSTYTFDGADQIRTVTLTNAITVTFGAPTGITPNAFYVFRLAAGDTSARAFAWNAAYKFPAATAPLTSGTVTNGASDIITFIGGAANTLLYVGHQADVR